MPETETESALSSTAIGAVLFSAGRILSNVLGFIVNLILTNWFGPTGYGVFTYAQTLVRFSMNFTDLGSDKGLMRFLPKFSDEENTQSSILWLSSVSVLVASIITTIGIYVAAPVISQFTIDSQQFITVLRVFSFIIPFRSLTRVVQNTFRALDSPAFQITISEFLHPLSKLAAAGLTVILAYSVEGSAFALLVTTALTLIISVVLLLKNEHIRPNNKSSKLSTFDYFKYTLPLTVNSAGWFFVNRIDILMVGFFLTSANVGYYRVSALLAGVVALPLNGLNQIFPPKASELYSNGNIAELDSFYSTITRWSISFSVPIVVGLIVFRREVLSLFGDGFAVGQMILVALVISGLANSLAGPCGSLLIMTDHQQLAMVNNWGLGILNISLNLYFINLFGMVGAAAATMTSVTILNVLKIFQVWYLEGLFPYSMSVYKPISSGVVSFISMALIKVTFQEELSGPGIVVLGITIGLIVFFGLLITLGLDESDRELLAKVVPKSVTTRLWG